MDIVRVQDAGLLGRGDAEVLQWVATENRVLLTHDVTTMKQHVERRIAAGLPMPGVFELRQDVPTGRAIEDIILLAECSLDREWEG